jgi:hypothetical protein
VIEVLKHLVATLRPDLVSDSERVELQDKLATAESFPDTCDHCHAEPELGRSLESCKGCLVARFCSEDCSRNAWISGHKDVCLAGQHQVHGSEEEAERDKVEQGICSAEPENPAQVEGSANGDGEEETGRSVVRVEEEGIGGSDGAGEA